MVRYIRQEIENKLLCMDGAEFQELCDSMLHYIYRNSLLIYNRVGHQLGKSKTIAGTPDTFLLLEENIVAFVEATTKADDIKNKLLGDISSCLNKSKIDLDSININRIILCYNNRIDVETELKIREAVQENIVIEHYGIDRIVEIILYEQPWLAEELNININKPGVYSLDKFIGRYNNSVLTYSSPLYSKFVSREKELAEMESILNTQDFLLVSGEAGVGKTRLVVEFLKRYSEQNLNANVIVLEENASLIETTILPILSNDRVCVVFIDDVNRKTTLLDELLQVKCSNTKKIKIVSTIRGYACEEFLKKYPLIQPQTHNLTPLSENCIKEILESSPYGIKNIIFQERIENVSRGNVRIAVMCGELAIKKNGFYNLVKDVPSLYDAYFSEHISKLSDNEYNVLSACAIFRCLKQGDSSTKSILEFCHIDDTTFTTAISNLENNECVEIWKYDDGKAAIKIVDQVFATYLVYDSVFKKRKYSLDNIFESYFHSHKQTIIDAIGGVLTAYHHATIGDIISASANRYADSVRENNELFQEAIDAFGFYMPEKALDYYDSMVSSLPSKTPKNFTTDYNLNDFSFRKDHLITQLIQYFHHKYEHSNLAFEILYDYCDRCPEKLPELVYWIRENVLYTKNDYLRGLDNLHNFVQHLFDCMSKYESCTPLFFAIAKTMLEYRFSTDYYRGQQFVVSQYTLCKDENVVEIRKMVIDKLVTLNQEHHSQVIDVLFSFQRCHEECAIDLAKSDIEAIYSVLPKIINPEDFRDILAANHFRDILGSILGKYNAKYKQLTTEYRTAKYSRFSALDFNNVNGKRECDSAKKIDAKQRELANYYLLDNEFDVSNLIEELKDYSRYWDSNKVYESIVQIITINVANNHSIGQFLFEQVLATFPDVIIKGYIGLLFSKVWSLGLFNHLLDSVLRYNGEYKYYLLYVYCNTLTYQNITNLDENICDYMRLALKNAEHEIQISIENLSKFGDISELVSIITKHNSESSAKITIWQKGFCNKEAFSNNVNKAAEIYKQQISLYKHFDCDNSVLAWIYEWNPETLLEMLDFLICNDVPCCLSFIFSKAYNYAFVSSIVEKLVGRVLNYNAPIGKILFTELKETNSKDNAIDFVQRYIKENIDRQDAISFIIDACLYIDRDVHDESLLYYLNNVPNEQSIENFDFWTEHSFTYGGDTTYGDIIGQKWNAVLSVAEKIEDLRRRNKIVRFIKDKINIAKHSSDIERGERFIREV